MNDTIQATRPQPPVCVSLLPPADATDQMQAVALMIDRVQESKAGVAEIRLDSFKNIPDPAFFLEHAEEFPLLFTNRASWEGGFFQGTEEARLAPLVQAARLGAAFVDIELRTDEMLKNHLFTARDSSAAKKTKIIFSWHDFEATPDAATLADILERMQKEGGDIGKIAATPKDTRDVLQVFSLLTMASERHFPLIALSMGATGAISRVASIFLGGFMTYACLEQGNEAAPGQMSMEAMNRILGALS